MICIIRLWINNKLSTKNLETYTEASKITKQYISSNLNNDQIGSIKGKKDRYILDLFIINITYILSLILVFKQ
jgi:hypothetical protein